MIQRSTPLSGIMLFLLLAALLISLAATPVQAAPPGLSSPYAQNFNSLANSGTSNPWTDDSTLAGWYSSRTTYNASDGGSTTGSLYSFGTDAEFERALGSLGSNGTGAIYYGLALVNDTGTAIAKLSITYRGEQWRNGGNTTPHTLNVAYQINATDLTGGTWTPLNSLNFTGPVASATAGSLDGNDEANSINLNSTINLSLAAGDTVWLRWEDPNDSGGDHGLAIDDLFITAAGEGTPGPTDSATEGPTDSPTEIPTEGPTEVVDCENAPDSIYELQENGSKHNPSGTASAVRTVIGVVTGDFQPASPDGLDGYYVQAETGDGNPLTSDGIFVYDPAPFVADVVVGQKLLLTGTSREQFGQTQFDVTAVVDCGTGVIEPLDITLPFTTLEERENYEGMLVQVSASDGQPLTVTELFTLARFGEVVVSAGGRLINPTNFVEPGAAAIAQQNLNDRSRLRIDDGRNGTPADGEVPFIPTTETQFRQGFTTPAVTGIYGYGFSDYRLQPLEPITWTPQNLREEAPVLSGSLRVASFNVLNFFNGNGTGQDGAAGGFPTSRGADSLNEFNRQKAKTVAAILSLNADIIVLNELENDNSATEYSAIEELVDALNAAAGAGTYALIDTGIVGTDEIRVGLIYRSAAVQPVGSFAKLDNIAPFNVNTRPPVAQLFQEIANGEQFYVIANHFKSKGSCPGSGAEADQGDGQGCWNPTRVLAATELLNWINTSAYFDTDDDVLITGDLNAYALEDPIDTLKNGGYTNLIEAFVGPGNIAYSYTFSGQSGYLDHALASASLLAQITGVVEWHINADEPIGRDYNDALLDSGENTSELRQPYLYEANAFRTSDHDPLVIGLALGQVAPTEVSTEAPTTAATDVATEAATEVATNVATEVATEAPTQMPTATPTDGTGATELLINGGFEAKTGGNKPDITPWTQKNNIGDKIKCNKEGKIVAHAGDCAFLFKGSSSEASVLQQGVDVTSLSFTAGEMLDFSVFIKATNATAAGKIAVVVKYSDVAEPDKINVSIATNTDYTEATGSLILTSASVSKIKVQIKHRSPAGKVFLDQISLVQNAAAAGLIPRTVALPVQP